MDGMEEEQQAPAMNNEKPNILVTGTPGVGKTTFSRLLSEYIEALQYINVGDLIKERKLYTKWDDTFDVPIFDEDMVCDALEPLMQQGGYIVDFHTSGFFPQRWFNLVVLLRCNNTDLYDRLKARGYTEKKITENIECEILDVTQEEVFESYDGDIILELKNEKESDVEVNINAIIERLKQWKAQKDAQQL